MPTGGVGLGADSVKTLSEWNKYSKCLFLSDLYFCQILSDHNIFSECIHYIIFVILIVLTVFGSSNYAQNNVPNS